MSEEGKRKREKNLRPFNTLDPEEVRKIQSKGGIKHGEKHRARKEAQELINTIMELKPRINEQVAEQLKTMGYKNVPTFHVLAILNVMKAAANGDLAALEFLYNYADIPDRKTRLEKERIEMLKTSVESEDRPIIIDQRPI